MNRTVLGTIHDPLDLVIYINDETTNDDGYNSPEFLSYTYFKSGKVFFDLNDDGDGEVTFAIEDIDSVIEALNEIKAHHVRHFVV